MDARTVVAIISVVIAVVSLGVTMRRNFKNDDSTAAAEHAVVMSKLDTIVDNVRDMKSDLREMKSDVKAHGEKILVLEQRVNNLYDILSGINISK